VCVLSGHPLQGTPPRALEAVMHDSVKAFVLFCIQRKPDGTRPSSLEVLRHPFLTLPAPEDDDDVLCRPGTAATVVL
jgi:hypothetical protein